MTALTGYGGHHPRLDYNLIAAAEPNRAELTERKYCEGGCGGCFWRPVPIIAKQGEKLCGPCKAREEKARETANLTRRKDVIGTVRKYPARDVFAEADPSARANIRHLQDAKWRLAMRRQRGLC